MRARKTMIAAMLAGLLVAGLAGCDRDGPAERAGEKIDDAAKDVQQGVEKAADKVEDAAKDVQEKVQDGK